MLAGALAGAILGAMLSLFVIIGNVVNLRAVMLQASPELYQLLTFDLGVAGFWAPIVMGVLLGAAAGRVDTEGRPVLDSGPCSICRSSGRTSIWSGGSSPTGTPAST